jgi:hypothetical protein
MINFMDNWKTLTGMSLTDAMAKLREVLIPEAYKAVPGAGDFTDIDPSYLTKVSTDVFGICGIGWGYTYDIEAITVDKDVRTSSSGRERTVYMAGLNRLDVWFAYVDDDGNIRMSATIPTSGGSENENRGYAVRGAITNAIGAAFAKLTWQLYVYMGMVDHKNAGTMYKRQQDKKDGKQEQAQTAGKETAIPAPAADKEPVKHQEPARAPAEEKMAAPEPAKTVEPAKETPKAATFTIPEDLEARITWADAITIPDGVGAPLVGRTLGSAKKDAHFGLPILKYLSGKFPSASNKYFKPGTPDQEMLQRAAEILYDVESAKSNGKTKQKETA